MKMTIELCDICGQPLGKTYTDEYGKTWDNISFQEKKYRAKKWVPAFSWPAGSSWTEYLSVCGKCRAALAKRNGKEQE